MSRDWTAASSSGSSRLAGRDDLLAQREDREDGLQGAGGAEQVTGLALGGAHQGVLAERGADRRRLGGVADRGRRGVRVHVPDVGRRQPGVAERRPMARAPSPRRAGRPGRSRRRCRRRRPAAVDAGATGLGGVAALEHEQAAALTEHEAVAALVERAGGALGLVVAGRHGAHRGEPGHRQRVHAGLGTPDQHDVGAVEAQQVQAPADASAPEAQALTGVHAALGADRQADGGRRAVGHEHRDGEGGDPLAAPFSSRTSS